MVSSFSKLHTRPGNHGSRFAPFSASRAIPVRVGAKTRNPDERRAIFATPGLIFALTDDAWLAIDTWAFIQKSTPTTPDWIARKEYLADEELQYEKWRATNLQQIWHTTSVRNGNCFILLLINYQFKIRG
jgi:hypothetical protein